MTTLVPRTTLALALVGLLCVPSAVMAQTEVGLDKVDLLTVSSVPSGSKVLFSTDLTGPAPAGGVVVSLNHGAGSGPATVTVPAGLWSQNFETTTPAVSATTTVTVSATYKGVTRTNQVQVTPPALNTVSVSPNNIAFGTAVTGTVRLTGWAATGGVVVSLNHGGGSGPASVTVPAGQSSATFQTSPQTVAATTTLTIGATYQGVTKTASLTVTPAASAASLTVAVTGGRAGSAGTTPPAVWGSGTFGGTVTLAQAPATQVAVPLTSNNAAAVVPAAVSVPAGQPSATFTIQTSMVAADASVTISAGQGATVKTAALTVRAWPALLRFIDVPPTIVSGTEVSAHVRCNCTVYPMPLYGASVGVQSSRPDLVTVTGGALSDGRNEAYITIKTQPVAAATSVVLTATFANTVTRTVTLEPAAQVKSLSLSPQQVYEVGTATGTLTLDKAAGTGGAKVALRSNSGAVTVPADVTVTEGQTTATFTATAAALGSANITARRAGGVEKSARMDVQSVEVLRVELPATVYENGSASGTVVLMAPAAASGLKVTLASSGGAVTVPPDVTIGAGTSSATFPVLTSSPGSATISAKRTGGSVERQVAVTVKRNEIKSLALSPASVVEGGSATGTVTLDASAGAGGLVVALNGLGVTVPSEVTVGAGTDTATFTATSLEGTTGARIVTARRSGTAVGSMAFRAAALTVARNEVTALSFSPASVVEGRPATGTVTLDAAAGAGGVTVILSSAGTNVTIPAEVAVAAGATTATFTATAKTPGNAAISARRGSGAEKQASLLVKAVQVKSVAVSPGEVKAGVGATGTVTLDAPAPDGGVTVALKSSIPSLTLPAAVTVSAGSTTATFTATAAANAVAGSATIEASRRSAVAGLSAAPKATTTLTIKK